jgi:hypothetical protein
VLQLPTATHAIINTASTATIVRPSGGEGLVEGESAKACAIFSVNVREGAWLPALDKQVIQAFRSASVGFNGIFILGGPEQVFHAPEWPEEPVGENDN